MEGKKQNDVRVETDIMMYLSTDDIRRLRQSFHGEALSIEEFVTALQELLKEHITDKVITNVFTRLEIYHINRLSLWQSALIYLILWMSTETGLSIG